MAIDPYKGGKCWSCKYCEDVGYYDENLDSVYKRKCNYPGKDYLDYCSKSCYNYVWDGKDSDFNYTYKSVPSGSYYSSSTSSSSSSSSSSGSSASSDSSTGKGCLIVFIILAILIGGAYFLFGGVRPTAEEKTEEPTSQQAPAEDQRTAVIEHTGNVNLREKGSSKSDIITSMPPGSTVTVFEETKNWARIEFEGQEGWCFKKYLKFTD